MLICGNVLCFQIAKLQPHDMTAVSNMKLIGESRKGSSGIFPLKFGIAKVNVFNRYFLNSFQLVDQYLTSSYAIIRKIVQLGKSDQVRKHCCLRAFIP